jgi:hypothetical protein
MKRNLKGQYVTIPEPEIRECSRCRVPKPLSEFPKGQRRKSGQVHYRYCKACHYIYQRLFKLIHEFNLQAEEYDIIANFQNNVCAICGRPPKPGKCLSIDHCHKTGLLRGLLCWLCNRLLGIFRDDPQVLRRALAYLENPPATAALGAPRFTTPGRVGTKKRRKTAASFQGSKYQPFEIVDGQKT